MSQIRIDENLEAAIYDYMVAVLDATFGTDKVKVIWDKQIADSENNQSPPRPNLPFVALNISTLPFKEGNAEMKFKEPKEGTTDGISANKLIDGNASFLTQGLIKVGDIAKNLTDSTETTVIAIDNDGQLSVNDDIFVLGDDYQILIRDTFSFPMRKAFTLSAKAFSGAQVDASLGYYNIMEAIVNGLELESFMSILRKAGLAIRGNNAPIDLSGLLETVYEFIANVDIFLAYTKVIDDVIGQVDRVSIDGTVGTFDVSQEVNKDEAPPNH